MFMGCTLYIEIQFKNKNNNNIHFIYELIN